MVLLITSGIEKKFKKKKESVLYAGDWVLSNKINSNKFLKKNKVFKTFWENTKKIDDFGTKIFILRKKTFIEHMCSHQSLRKYFRRY